VAKPPAEPAAEDVALFEKLIEAAHNNVIHGPGIKDLGPSTRPWRVLRAKVTRARVRRTRRSPVGRSQASRFAKRV